MRAGMTLLPDDAQDRPLGGRKEATPLLNGGGIDPVLGVAEFHPGRPTRAHHLIGRGEGGLEHVTACGRGGTEVAGERFLDDGVLPGAGRRDPHRYMEMVRHAQVHHVDGGVSEDGLGVRRHAGDVKFLGERLGPLGPGGGHDNEIHVDPPNLSIGFGVQMSHEACADESDPDGRWYLLRHVILP